MLRAYKGSIIATAVLWGGVEDHGEESHGDADDEVNLMPTRRNRRAIPCVNCVPSTKSTNTSNSAKARGSLKHLVVCINCYRHDLRCDRGDTCRECSKVALAWTITRWVLR
jgi:hypothetical protein